MIAFANINDDALIDKIPLHEIVKIEAVTDLRSIADGGVADRSQKSFSVMAPNNSMRINAESFEVLRIFTLPNGHNAGREYCLRAESSQLCEELISKISDNSKAAKRAAADSKFARFHLKIQQMFASERFQAATAALIILV
jgi:hypothetical protein